MRIGHGIDVHAFNPDAGQALRLGGVTIPDGPGLQGHSDADVVLHALTDALLGAVSGGDLGSMVGIDRPQTRQADSAAFVIQALNVVAKGGWQIANVDLTVIAQRPRLADHLQAIRRRIAGLLEVDTDQVSVKATTTDHLGFVGRAEGITCFATALLTIDDEAIGDTA